MRAMGPQAEISSFNRNSLLLAFAWLVALVATIGSLYYSEVRLFPPCTLCWYQRIAMYPLVFMLAIATWRGDTGIRPYALTLSLVGLFWSGYHLLEQRVPGFAPSVCRGPIPCNIEFIPSFPIPLQAAIAFLLISIALFMVRPAKR